MYIYSITYISLWKLLKMCYGCNLFNIKVFKISILINFINKSVLVTSVGFLWDTEMVCSKLTVSQLYCFKGNLAKLDIIAKWIYCFFKMIFHSFNPFGLTIFEGQKGIDVLQPPKRDINHSVRTQEREQIFKVSLFLLFIFSECKIILECI